jgi:hypothetical protein
MCSANAFSGSQLDFMPPRACLCPPKVRALMLRSRVALSDYYSFDFLGNPRRKDRFSLRFDSTAGTLTGRNLVTRIWDNLSFQGSGFFGVGNNVVRQTQSSTRAEAITLAAPDTTDGKWTLDLNLAASGNRIGGVGLVQLTNGELLKFQTMGTWLPKMQRANLLLKGMGAAKGSTLRLQLVGPQLDLGWLRGTVAGQGLHFP